MMNSRQKIPLPLQSIHEAERLIGQLREPERSILSVVMQAAKSIDRHNQEQLFKEIKRRPAKRKKSR